MHHRSRLLVVAVYVTMLTGAACAEPEARVWNFGSDFSLPYRWSAPEKLEPGKRYPLVLFLHGSGERGNDNTSQMNHGVKPILKGAKELDEPTFLIAPQCPCDVWWAPITGDRLKLTEAGKPNLVMDEVVGLLDEILKSHPVDPARVYVTGLSMGGFGTWDLLARIPGKIAAAVPICGGGDPDTVDKFKDVPIWVIHGEVDPVVPIAASRLMIAALKEVGVEPKTTLYPNVAHDSWTQAYDNPELIQWLFAQRKK